MFFYDSVFLKVKIYIFITDYIPEIILNQTSNFNVRIGNTFVFVVIWYFIPIPINDDGKNKLYKLFLFM